MSGSMVRSGVVFGMPEDEYHGGGLQEMSSSHAKEVDKSVGHYRHKYMASPPERKSEWDVGTGIHTKVLGIGSPAVAYPESVLSAAGSIIEKSKKWAQERRAEGLVPVKKAQLQIINAAAEAVLANEDARVILEQPGAREASVFATCPDTGLALRGRFDVLPDEWPVAGDVKSVSAGGAGIREFSRSVDDWGYDIQLGHYLYIAHLLGLPTIDLAFIVVEKGAPFGVQVHHLDEQWRDIGLARARWAREDLARAKESDEWPIYTPGPKLLAAPPWVVSKYQDKSREGREIVY